MAFHKNDFIESMQQFIFFMNFSYILRNIILRKLRNFIKFIILTQVIQNKTNNSFIFSSSEM